MVNLLNSLSSTVIFGYMSQGSASGHPMAQGNCVYALARQSLGNLAQAVIGSTQDPFELFIINVR